MNYSKNEKYDDYEFKEAIIEGANSIPCNSIQKSKQEEEEENKPLKFVAPQITKPNILYNQDSETKRENKIMKGFDLHPDPIEIKPNNAQWLTENTMMTDFKEIQNQAAKLGVQFEISLQNTIESYRKKR
eukprot:gb/GECH01009716.1/.p1 GENE.gb/GECH01009716.1/~~gb/GECH01009716.1/.p1  ORF type:complete len:130 (+),score=33.55 gb/GECH01009716.1/:1-390(+)